MQKVTEFYTRAHLRTRASNASTRARGLGIDRYYFSESFSTCSKLLSHLELELYPTHQTGKIARLNTKLQAPCDPGRLLGPFEMEMRWNQILFTKILKN